MMVGVGAGEGREVGVGAVLCVRVEAPPPLTVGAAQGEGGGVGVFKIVMVEEGVVEAQGEVSAQGVGVREGLAVERSPLGVPHGGVRVRVTDGQVLVLGEEVRESEVLAEGVRERRLELERVEAVEWVVEGHWEEARVGEGEEKEERDRDTVGLEVRLLSVETVLEGTQDQVGKGEEEGVPPCMESVRVGLVVREGEGDTLPLEVE